MKIAKRVMPIVAAAASVVGCGNKSESQEAFTPDFGPYMEVYGEPRSVSSVQVIRCVRLLSGITIEQGDTGYTSVAKKVGSSEENASLFGVITKALDKTPGLKVGETITTVDPEWCTIGKVKHLTEATQHELAAQANQNYNAREYGASSTAMFGTPGADSLALAQSRDLVRVVFIEQP